jgi:hypothetical protein
MTTTIEPARITPADLGPVGQQSRSVFADLARQQYCHRFVVELHVGTLVGGTPTDQNVAEGWIRTKMGLDSDDLIRQEVERVMENRGVTPEAAMEEVTRNRHLSGFERNFRTPLARATQQQAIDKGFVFEGVRQTFTQEQAERTFGELLIRGRQVKAMLKEAVMIGVGAGHIEATKWGKTNKAVKGFVAEHLFVLEDEILLDEVEPTEIKQAFVHTFRGSGIKLEERLHGATVRFTLAADFDFTTKDKDFFGKVMVTAEQNGLGASRSQGFGRFETVRFDAL